MTAAAANPKKLWQAVTGYSLWVLSKACGLVVVLSVPGECALQGVAQIAGRDDEVETARRRRAAWAS